MGADPLYSVIAPVISSVSNELPAALSKSRKFPVGDVSVNRLNFKAVILFAPRIVLICPPEVGTDAVPSASPLNLRLSRVVPTV